MAIRTNNGKVRPSVVINHVQFSHFSLSTSTVPPYRIKISAVVREYGLDGTDRMYEHELTPLSIQDVDSYIGSLPTADQIKAATAMQKMQEALGAVSEIYYGINFVGVD